MFGTILAETIGIKEVDEISAVLIRDNEQFEAVFRMIFEKEGRIAWHAAWVMEKVSEKKPALFTVDKYKQILHFVLSNKHQGLQRFCLSILVNLPVYQPISIEFLNLCFHQMISPKESVGVQVLSMKMLLRISEIETDFRKELAVCLENTDDELYSAGYRVAKRTVLKSLKKRNKTH